MSAFHHKKYTAHHLLMMDVDNLLHPDGQPSGEASKAHAGDWCFSLMSHLLATLLQLTSSSVSRDLVH